VGVLPIFALIPDITYVVFQKVIYPTPTDWVLDKQKKEPKAMYDGFDGVYAAYMPTGAPSKLQSRRPSTVHALDSSVNAGEATISQLEMSEIDPRSSPVHLVGQKRETETRKKTSKPVKSKTKKKKT
jgi:hypothetical protein